MNDRIKNLLDKIKAPLAKLSPKVKKLLIALIAVLILVSVGAAVYLNTRPYEVLFTGLNSTEASEIIGKLQESEVPYKYETNGTILVPSEQEQALKAQLVYEGYPKSGFTYNVFKENIGLTTTDFEKESYKLFDLQDRMGATISLFEGVKEAKVTIAPGEEKRYVLGGDQVGEASASVVVIMKDGETLNEQQVTSIKNLVSKSIAQLKIDNVSVLDQYGNDLSGDFTDSQSGANKVKMEFERETENNIKAKVLNLLAPVYGEENVRISVHCVADVDKKIRELISYTSPTNDNKGLFDNENQATEIVRDPEAEGGVPGAEGNADIPIYNQTTADGTENYFRNEANIDYLVNQLKEQSQVDSALIADLTISVAINGRDLGALSNEQLLGVIGKSAGIPTVNQEEKIAIIAAPFYQAVLPPQEIIDEEVVLGLSLKNLIIIAAASFVLLILLIVLLAALSKKKKRKRRLQLEAEAAAASGGMQIPVNNASNEVQEFNYELLNIKNEHGIELKNKIRDFTEQNPEIAAQLLKQWLRGGEGNGN